VWLSNLCIKSSRRATIAYTTPDISAVLRTSLILLILLCLVPSACARDYTLEEATKDITIDPNGIVHIEESISYAFDGHYNRVYRDLKISSGESIQNIELDCSESGCTFRVEPTPDGYKLIGELPESTPEYLTFYISYDIYGAVKVHSDVSEFQYNIWGSGWEKPLGNLYGSITFPVKNESKIQYWVHPAYYSQEVSLEQNTLNFETKEIPSYQDCEIRIVFPRIEFPNSSFVQLDNFEKLEEILATEKEYQHKNSILENIYSLTFVIAFFVLAFPFLIYFKYGREPEIDYKAIYEREPPTNSKPAVVNAIIKGEMGTPTMDGFTATVMDLVRLGYISLRTVKSKGKWTSGLYESESKDIIIELSDCDTFTGAEKDILNLEDFEKDVLDLLKNHASENKEVSWKKLNEELGSGTNFYEFITKWNLKVKAHTEFDKLFQSTGKKYIIIFAWIIIITSLIHYFKTHQYFSSEEFPLASNLDTMVTLIVFFEVLMLISSPAFEKFGRWTAEGELYYNLWNGFKKYLTDFHALKNHPPESIKIWNSYLVYATSLGIAKEVLRNMALVVPAEQLRNSPFYHKRDSYDQLSLVLWEAYSSSNPGASGGDGGGGDGGGGDGGGAD